MAMTHVDSRTHFMADDTAYEHVSRLEAVIDAIPAPVAVLDAETHRLLLTNRRFVELTCIDAAADPTVTFDRAFPALDAESRAALEEARGGQIHPLLRLTVRSGARARVLEAAFRALGGARPARELLFAGVDVTEREQLREDLAHLVGQLSSVIGVIPDAIRVFDPDGHVVRANAQAVRDGGVDGPFASLSEQVETEAPCTLDGTTVNASDHPTARALRGERVRAETLRVRRGEADERLLEVSASPLHDELGTVRGAVSIERDVTDRFTLLGELEDKARQVKELYARASTETERLERMVGERTAELLAIQERRARERRLAAIGQLAAGVMHDVNNALNPIMAAAYLLERHADDPAAVREYAARIAKAAETGAATSSRVGRFIRQDPIDESSEAQLDLAMLASEVVAMMRSLWAERHSGGPIALETRLSPAHTLGVAGEVRSAIMNLIHNALDAMPDGGTITVETRSDDSTAIVEVRDTGIGMTPHVREHAFEPFFSTKDATGSGLGLAEVYGIMKRHRGAAEIESRPNEGTSVRLRFPGHRSGTRASPAGAMAVLARRRVLLVEDNDDGREFLRLILQSHGHEVASVATLREGLSLLESDNGDPFEVLISDIGLPDGSGWDLVRRARARYPRMRIGVVTGWEGSQGKSSEADFVLRKPVPPADLVAFVASETAP